MDETRENKEHSDEDVSRDEDAADSGEEVKKRRTHSPAPPPHIAASPPKFVSFDELMQAANGVSNMKLAHEIAVDTDFKFEKTQPEQNSIQKQVEEVMHKAFWDSLQEKLHDDPPDFSQAFVLLKEVKEVLLDLLLPQHKKLRTHINEVLDLDLIRQKAEHEALDIRYYAEYVISIMARLCAPARDDRIAQIRQIQDVVSLFKEIFAVLDLMKMDMANFTVQQIRPYLQQQSVQYERTKFSQFLKQQEENNLDGLQLTKDWLYKSFEKLKAECTASASAVATITPTPAAILHEAYMQLLDWDLHAMHATFPETLLLDQSRFIDLRDKTKRLTVVSAILLLTFNSVAAPVASIQQFKEKLKDNIMIIIGSVSESELPDLMENVSEQIIKDVDSALQTHGFSRLQAEQQTLLRGQLQDVTSPDHPVHKIMRSRLLGFVHGLLASSHTTEAKVPAGMSSVASELSHIAGQFIRLVSYNRSVFGLHYAEIIGALLQTTGDISPR